MTPAASLPHFAAVVQDLDIKRARVLAELEPALADAVVRICSIMGYRVTPYCGYRGPHEQQDALAAGTSRAAFGESPHNFHPALACDLVIDPRHVEVRANPDPKNPGFPDLWDDGLPRAHDDGNPAAMQVWTDLDAAAAQVGLERVDIGRGKHDNPHVQRPGWLARVRARSDG